MEDKTNTMNTTDIINKFITDRGSSKNTKYAYIQSIRIFEEFTHMKLPNLFYLVENEQNNNINWKNQTIREILIQFRIHLYDNYKTNTAKQHLNRILAIFRHYGLTIETLPYFSTKKSNHSIPIDPDKLVNRDILKLCINVKNPLLKAITLFMSSTGMAKSDALKLTVEDFLTATIEYHNTYDLHSALNILQNKDDVVGYWNNEERQKTGQIYYTFSSHESTTAIVQYLLSREHLRLDSPLFDISPKYLSDLFKETNDKLELGKNGEYSRFTAHMLRRYHATQLIEAGMSESKVDILQGRKPKSVAYQSYIKLKPSQLKQEYIECLPYLVVEDINRVKTELENVKEENERLKEDNEKINIMWEEFNNKDKRNSIWNELKGE